MLKALLFFLLLSLTVKAGSSLEKPNLVWAFATSSKVSPPPSANILSEKHKLLIIFKRELSDYNHTFLEATLPRIEEEMKKQSRLCYPGSSEFSRRRQFAYLTSLYIQPAPQLVVTKELGERLLKKYKGHLKLSEVMKDKTLHGNLAEGRSYGESIDRILQNPDSNIKRQVYNTFIQTVVDQIKIGRVDFTLEYPFVVESMELTNNDSAKALMSIPLSDAAPYSTQYVACSKTPEGLEIIRKLDEVVKKNVSSDEYWTGVLGSVAKKDKAEFKQAMKKFIKMRAAESVIIK